MIVCVCVPPIYSLKRWAFRANEIEKSCAFFFLLSESHMRYAFAVYEVNNSVSSNSENCCASIALCIHTFEINWFWHECWVYLRCCRRCCCCCTWVYDVRIYVWDKIVVLNKLHRFIQWLTPNDYEIKVYFMPQLRFIYWNSGHSSKINGNGKVIHWACAAAHKFENFIFLWLFDRTKRKARIS